METYVLRWTKDNLPFWQGIDGGDKHGIYEVADVINEYIALKAGITDIYMGLHGEELKTTGNKLRTLLTKETNNEA